ncbi:MAG: hypothetical protein WCA10_06885 [Terracidiphilus sp.]
MSSWLDGLFTERNLLILLCGICLLGFVTVIKILVVVGDTMLDRLSEIRDSLTESISDGIRAAESGRKRDLDDEIEAECGPGPEQFARWKQKNQETGKPKP